MDYAMKYLIKQSLVESKDKLEILEKYLSNKRKSTSQIHPSPSFTAPARFRTAFTGLDNPKGAVINQMVRVGNRDSGVKIKSVAVLRPQRMCYLLRERGKRLHRISWFVFRSRFYEKLFQVIHLGFKTFGASSRHKTGVTVIYQRCLIIVVIMQDLCIFYFCGKDI